MPLKVGSEVTLHGEERDIRNHIIASIGDTKIAVMRCGKQRYLSSLGIPLPQDKKCEGCHGLFGL